MMVADTHPPRTSDWGEVDPVNGCWVDGHWGHYGVLRMIEIADEYGCPLTDDDRALMSAYDKGEQYDADEFYSLADEIEGWMNAWLAPEGYSFGWSDGEFFLMSNQDWLASH